MDHLVLNVSGICGQWLNIISNHAEMKRCYFAQITVANIPNLNNLWRKIVAVVVVVKTATLQITKDVQNVVGLPEPLRAIAPRLNNIQ